MFVVDRGLTRCCLQSEVFDNFGLMDFLDFGSRLFRCLGLHRNIWGVGDPCFYYCAVDAHRDIS